MPIFEEHYGNLPTGEAVSRYTLMNRNGLSLKVISFGAIITECHVPDRYGVFADVVLGLPSLSHYLAGHPYCGAMVGRTAGRITGAQFELDGECFQLVANQKTNNLHGGLEGFDKKLWKGAAFANAAGESGVSLRYHSPDGEEGFPGDLTIEVIYTLTDTNALRIETRAATTRATPFAPTNHSYFNLAGAGEGSRTIAGHHLQILADTYAPTDPDDCFVGSIGSVIDLPIDYREPTQLESRIHQSDDPHGAMYFIRRKKTGDFVCAARLEDRESGRILEVFTDETCINTYTGKFLDADDFIIKNGQRCPAYAGIALECQSFPNAVNMPSVCSESGILYPNHNYEKMTEYRFGIALNSKSN